MHAHRRPVSPFDCCDPLREYCVGASFTTMFDHAQARAGWTGYRQYLFWKPMHGGWLVIGRSQRIKPKARAFDNDVKRRKVDAQ